MTLRRLHDGCNDGLHPLESLNLAKVDSFATLVRGMGKTAFGGRCLGEALDVLLAMIRDTDCGVIMTLSGAMTVAKQGSIIREMIDRGMVAGIVSTGALVAHGLTESMGMIHYAAPDTHDSALYANGYNRIYDTLEMEANLNEVADLVTNILNRETPEDGIWSSARLCRTIGRHLDQLDYGTGILRSAWHRKVPVFIPAFTDCEMGLDLATWAMGKTKLGTEAMGENDHPLPEALFTSTPSFNPFLDLQEYARLVSGYPRLGIFTIGGGVPRNWAQQIGPYFEITCERLGANLDIPRFGYGVRICPEPAHWGGLSGCTYAEGVSWGKFIPVEQGGRYAEVHADATLVWPLLMKAVCEELDRTQET